MKNTIKIKQIKTGKELGTMYCDNFKPQEIRKSL